VKSAPVLARAGEEVDERRDGRGTDAGERLHVERGIT
jgi:hypothetical protein